MPQVTARPRRAVKQRTNHTSTPIIPIDGRRKRPPPGSPGGGLLFHSNTVRFRTLAKAWERGREWSALDEVAVVDCLTTGHDVELDRIVQLAAVVVDLKSDDDRDRTVFEALLDPKIPVPAEATLVHGITSVDAVGQEGFGEIALKVQELIGDRPVVGFNAGYAAGFLDAEMRRHGRKTLYRANAHDVQAALHGAWGYLPTLSNAVTRLGVTRGARSAAVGRAVATARLARILANASPDMLSDVPGDRWVDEEGDHGAERATRPQLAAIKNLGGDPKGVTSTRQAAEAIDALRPGKPKEMPAPDSTKWFWIAVLGLAALVAWLLRQAAAWLGEPLPNGSHMRW